VKATEHDPAESVQIWGSNLPEETCENAMFPEGCEDVPTPASWTIAVHVLFELTGRVAGAQKNEVDDGRFETERTKLVELI
jgi:hypothetical protein